MVNIVWLKDVRVVEGPDTVTGTEVVIIIVVALPKTLETGEDAPPAVPGPELDEGGTVEGPAEESIVEAVLESEPVPGEEPTGVDGSVDEVENQWKA